MGLASLLISLLIFSAAISPLDINEEGHFITSCVNEPEGPLYTLI
jgi:hypothetical protein